MNLRCEEVKDKRKPVRQCALTRTRSREDELLRFVLDPQGRVVPDIKRKLPGRGVWITACHEAVEISVRKNAFSRGFKQKVEVEPALADLIASLLRSAALQDLALANKAGCVVAGYGKVEEAVKKAKTIELVHASDASADGSGKLNRLAQAVLRRVSKELNPITCFTSAELSSALGKSNVNHAAIAEGGAGRTFLRSAKRYISYWGPHLASGSVADAPVQDKA